MISGKQKPFIIIACVAAVCAGFSFFITEGPAAGIETYTVESGEFLVKIDAAGELKAKTTLPVSYQRIRLLGYEYTIVKLAPEGSMVEEGDFLVQIDAAKIEDNIAETQNVLDTKYKELAVLRAKQYADSLRRENELNKLRLELEMNKLAYSKIEFERETKKKRDLLTIQKTELQIQDQADKIEIERVNDLQERNKLLDEIRKSERQLEDSVKQLGQATISAPRAGMVVYKQLRVLSSGMFEKTRIGSTFYYRDPVIELPELDEMLVSVSVSEKEVGLIKPGNEAIITLDVNNVTYYGTVSRVATIAKKEYVDVYAYPDKKVSVYPIEILIKNDGTLKPGMLAECSIITDRISDALFVPLQCLVEEDSLAFIFVEENGAFAKTAVTTGSASRDFIVITDGLEPGMRVALLNPHADMKGIGREQMLDSQKSASLIY